MGVWLDKPKLIFRFERAMRVKEFYGSELSSSVWSGNELIYWERLIDVMDIWQ
ncbi:hypothetical protein C8D91_0355 [Marinicella litoralis]|uniref:Uncharacterized protein n=1 Tax=Marinicella litoralis TaxID=644220 RepID=A0A4R6Y062_9GAMM|nr:hypothetical protein C8D91_0355 [Marinicella litoralis]